MSGTPCRRQQFRDFVQRRNAAEHVGNVAEYHQIGTVFQRLFQRRNHSRTVPQRRIQHTVGSIFRAVSGRMTALCS